MNRENQVESTVAIQPKVITGIFDHQKLMTDKSFSWFKKPYHSYTSNPIDIAFLKTMRSQLSFLIFAATWNNESHELLPSFFKVMSRTIIKAEKITLCFLDHNKKCHEGLEKKYRVTKLPTIVVFCKNRPFMKIEGRSKANIETEIAERLRSMADSIIF